MELHPVVQKDHPHLGFIRTLYESTFPVQERRNWEQLLQLLTEPAMKLSTVMVGKELVGFVIGWKIGNWYYVEHLAIDPAQRGKKYGEKVMKSILGTAHGRVILEVEKIHDTDSGRRIEFYERLGYSIIPVDYEQPPYRKGEPVLPMMLMSNPAIDDHQLAKSLAGNIRATVYERYYS